MFSSSRNRIAVTLAFTLAATALVLAPGLLGLEWSRGGVLVDLGSEFLGLALTVSLLDWFFERRRLRADARRYAWEMFHAVERAAWVWQGGPLRLETDELLGLLHGASATDEFAPSTEGLLLNLGIRSRELLKGERQAVSAISGFSEALHELTVLAAVGERRRPSVETVRQTLFDGARRLAEILDLAAPRIPVRLIRDRTADLAAQETRYGRGMIS